jgi:4-amino-4-deoxy-L-arabinose transferase-like glycosyltransferase
VDVSPAKELESDLPLQQIKFKAPAWSALVTVLLIAASYFIALDGLHIPKIGDEFVYAHIARLTAETGQWLPLQSDLPNMRNTKPPLLFWQAMVAGQWGTSWTLFNLRLPSVFYTFCITIMCAALAWRLALLKSMDSAAATLTGVIAALLYLGFFSTYRYGRPYLTSAPETFWMLSIFITIAWSPQRVLASRWLAPVLFGLAGGVLCLYKSFAMVAPLGLALALIHQRIGAEQPLWKVFRSGWFRDALKVAVTCSVALLVFGLWFAFDPQPDEVWREFVVGENAGKFGGERSYLYNALAGPSNIWSMLLSYPINTGLLMFPAFGSLWAAWRYRAQLTDGERALFLWALALLAVFMLPNLRSGRYLMPAMPVLAVFIALQRERIANGWWRASVVAGLIGLAVIAQIAWGVGKTIDGSVLGAALLWTWIGAGMIGCLIALRSSRWLRPWALVISSVMLTALAWVQFPLEGRLGRFTPETVRDLSRQEVAVPSNFNGQFERYEFLLPGARIVPYSAAQPTEVTTREIDLLLDSTPYVLVQRKLGEPPCTRCEVIDQRWDVRSRHTRSETLRTTFTSPETFWLAK